MDDRVERLLNKAEQATDRNDLDQAEQYRVLASNVAYLRKQEAKMLARTLSLTGE
jgi:hypothetical protein